MTERKPPTRAAKKPAPRLKNYRSQADLSHIFESIRQSLATHKARKIMFDYDDDGRAIAIAFMVEVNKERLVFRLPNRFDRVKRLVEKSNESMGRRMSDEALDLQAYRTSWANIRDWILAQMALIDAEMVDVGEVFFPYLLEQGGQTVYEQFQNRLGLPGPKSFSIKEVHDE